MSLHVSLYVKWNKKLSLSIEKLESGKTKNEKARRFAKKQVADRE